MCWLFVHGHIFAAIFPLKMWVMHGRPLAQTVEMCSVSSSSGWAQGGSAYKGITYDFRIFARRDAYKYLSRSGWPIG
jgi:hypothetical protein